METDTAIFAAGCFWGVQYYFDQVPGILETTAGYIGGHVQNPSYEQVCTHQTGHAEAVKIVFDPKSTTYETLLKQFFRMHDPTQMNRQGPDVGDNYRSAIFYQNEQQKKVAQKIIDELNKTEYNGKIVTTLEPGSPEAVSGVSTLLNKSQDKNAAKFWPAEDYHQKYTLKTGRGMCHIPYAPV